MIEDVEVNITVDTGSTTTLLGEKVYLKIPKDKRPELIKPLASAITTADGNMLKCLGQADFHLQMGHVNLQKSMVVTNIEDDVLLGSDLLQQDVSGPADLLLTKEKMMFRGDEIPLQFIQRSKTTERQTRKVRSSLDIKIPALTECLIDVCIDPNLDGQDEDCLLLQPDPSLAERFSVMMAACLTDPSQTKVMIFNPFEQVANIHKNTVLGSAESITSIVAQVHPGEEVCQTKVDECVRKTKDHHGSKIPDIPDHLQELFDQTSDGRSHTEQVAIAGLLLDFSDVFSKDGNDLGRTNTAEHVIDTEDSPPLRQPPHRIPKAFEGEDQAALEKLQQQKIIRPSTSPWASPIVLVRKKDGSVRPCVDYRKLNAVTKKDAFPIPRTSDCLDALAGAGMFSTLDITSAYNQIPVRETDVPKTAFVTKYGLFEYTMMPFGLCNAPATFQRMMEVALGGLQWNTCLIYLDDVIIFSKAFDVHIQRLRLVLQHIQAAGLKLKPSKCQLLQSQVKFLGHVISSEGVLPDPANVKKIQEWATPRTVKQVRAFLGMGNYYRRFIKSYSKIAKPLIDLTKKDRRFSWNEDCQAAFRALKEALIGPDVMAFPQDDCEFVLDTDACDFSIGAVLSQKQNGRERVVAYGSKMLSRSERNYCVTDRELLAVKFFVEHYKHYLLGRRFTVRTDHQALKWLFSLKEPKSRIARWIETLSAFDFSVEYRPGVQHGNADGMSRCPNPRECKCQTPDVALPCGPCHSCNARKARESADGSENEGQYQPPLTGRRIAENPVVRNQQQGHGFQRLWQFLLWAMLFFRITSAVGSQSIPEECCRVVTRRQSKPSWAMNYSLADLRKMQLEDSNLGIILQAKEANKRPEGQEVATLSPEARHYLLLWMSLEIHDGLLFRRFNRRDATGSHLQFLTPQKLRVEILNQMHDNILSGHLGQKKTREKLLQRFYWFEVREDVNCWVSKCEVCGITKKPSRKVKAPMGIMTVGAPWDRLSTDIVGPFPVTPRGNKYILVVTDHFSKWVEIFPIPDQSASVCAEKILNEVIARFGCPYELLSDQGRNYESVIFSELCKLLEIKKKRTSPGNPRCNGQTERFNRTMVQMIKAYLKGQEDEWDRNLGCLAAAYRATVHESTGLTPNLLVLGREVRLPAEVMFGKRAMTSETDIVNYGQYVTDLRGHLQHGHTVARKHLAAATKRQKDGYDAKANFHDYSQGDLVWYASDISQLHLAPKLRNPFMGPVLVLKKINDLNFLLQFDERGTKRVVHNNCMKPFLGEKQLPWAKLAVTRYNKKAKLTVKRC